METVLGRDGLKALRNSLDDPDKYARKAVELFHARSLIDTALVRLMREAGPNKPLIADLTYIQNGKRLADTENHQAFRSGFDRFLDAADSEWLISRMTGSVCAIAIGDTVCDVKGTGFLVGPDLVITNWHVIEWVAEMNNGKAVQKTTGDQIFCIFDHEEQLLPKPPLNGYTAGVVVRGAQPTWLVHGRLSLDGDGGDNAAKMVDQLGLCRHQVGDVDWKGASSGERWSATGVVVTPRFAARLLRPARAAPLSAPGQLRLKWDKGPIVQLNPDDKQPRVVRDLVGKGIVGRRGSGSARTRLCAAQRERDTRDCAQAAGAHMESGHSHRSHRRGHSIAGAGLLRDRAGLGFDERALDVDGNDELHGNPDSYTIYVRAGGRYAAPRQHQFRSPRSPSPRRQLRSLRRQQQRSRRRPMPQSKTCPITGRSTTNATIQSRYSAERSSRSRSCNGRRWWQTRRGGHRVEGQRRALLDQAAASRAPARSGSALRAESSGESQSRGFRELTRGDNSA
jgi:hypothetical protein